MRGAWTLGLLLLMAGCAEEPETATPRGGDPSIPVIPVVEGRVLMEGVAPSLQTGWSTGFQFGFGAGFKMDTTAPSGSYAWALDIDGDRVADYHGTTLPQTITHDYPKGGDFVITFVVETERGRSARAVELSIPEQISLTGRASSNASGCQTATYWMPSGALRYRVGIDPFDPMDPTHDVAPPTGHSFQFRDGAGAWSDAPMEGKTPEGATAFRLCPPQGWPLNFDFTVTFWPV